ncbi:MAG: hypothetical protein JW819_09955 [Candidatus Krumholzibacteriota bacterium]|nr:hypothetical protein [Candidatus Krumholzibacteriota bacterium]
MKSPHLFAPPLRRCLLLALALGAMGSATGAAAALLPPGGEVLASDERGISLRLVWDPGNYAETGAGLRLDLPGCDLAGEPGAPALPQYRALIALPPGARATLSWTLVAGEPLPGTPAPFPTLRVVPSGPEHTMPVEELIRDDDRYRVARPLAARLEGPRRLRDLDVAQLVVDPMGWDPEAGLTLARELRVTIRFLNAGAPRGVAREAVRVPERLWDGIYRRGLLNGALAGAWRRRVPARPMAAVLERDRGAVLRVLTDDTGLYGLAGDSLIARGIPAGTALDEIALYRTRLDWDIDGQPVYTEAPVARFFRDAAADGDLDAEDMLVFVGRNLRYARASVDSIEWYGKAQVFYLAVAPELAQDMPVAASWTESGAWTVPSQFPRRRRVYGEEDFFKVPPNDYYAGEPLETWDRNLYFFAIPLVSGGNNVQELAIASPGYIAGTEARLELWWQGQNTSLTHRHIAVELDNANGVTALPELVTYSVYNSDNPGWEYEPAVPADALVDGPAILRLDRTDEVPLQTYIKYWDLQWLSAYQADGDSLFFHAGGATGATEFQVGGLSREATWWELVRTDGATPVRLSLDALNQTGTPGDYTLRFRADLLGGETYWLADAAVLREPVLEAAEPVGFLAEPGPYDVLVIAHDDFAAGMDRWVTRRQAEGWRVRLLRTREVWEAFFGGSRGAIGLRNAARYAYQQWGTEALLLVGDGNKDSRAINQYADPDFVPVYCRYENVGGNETVPIDEWIVKFEPFGWPALVQGRLPVGDGDELDNLLDKIDCFESYTNSAGCQGAGAWRRDFFLIADDAWVWDSWGQPAHIDPSNYEFENGQRLIATVIEGSLPGDINAVPFYTSVITHPWYAEHPGATPSDIQNYLRPEISPIFVDSLSDGYLFAAAQTHANEAQLGHELYMKTAQGGNDHELLTNYGRPFVFAVYGCHANSFARHNEGNSAVGDCIGEKTLLVDGIRGAVASYASAGYELLYPNIQLGLDLTQLMFWPNDPEDQVEIFPDWRLGTLLQIAELRWARLNTSSQEYIYSWRYNLLGDPLLRLDAAAPRVRLFVDGEERAPAGDYLQVSDPGDTLLVEVLVADEVATAGIVLRDEALGNLPFEAWPKHSLDAVAPLDTMIWVDSLQAFTEGRGRAWYLRAEVPFDVSMQALVAEGTDAAGRLGRFRLPVARVVEFFLEGGDSLRDGQYVRAEGTLHLRLHVPFAGIPLSDFSLLVDSLPADSLPPGSVETWVDGEDPLLYHATIAYSWAPGVHAVEVNHVEQGRWGAITLRVDNRTRLASGIIFPNPFRSIVAFRYELSSVVRAGHLSIYTLSGRRIYHRRLEALSEGVPHDAIWDGIDQAGDRVANGVYVSRVVFTDLAGEEIVWEDKVVRMR